MNMSRIFLFIALAIVSVLLLHTTLEKKGVPLPKPLFPAKVEKPEIAVDQCARVEVYKACVASIPKLSEQRESTMYDDIRTRECTRSSAKLAFRLASTIKPECYAPKPKDWEE